MVISMTPSNTGKESQGKPATMSMYEDAKGQGSGFNQARFGHVNVTKEEADEGVEDICQKVIVMTDHGSKLGEGTGDRGRDPWITGSGRAA